MSHNLERLRTQVVLLQGPGEPWQQRVEERNIFSLSGENEAIVVRVNDGRAAAVDTMLGNEKAAAGPAGSGEGQGSMGREPMEGSS